MRWNKLVLLSFVLGILLPQIKIFGEGSKEIYVGSNNTYLYHCNDFVGKCNNGNGDRSQFAVYDCLETERLYFITKYLNEAVYLGFKGSGAGFGNKIVFRIKNESGTTVYNQRDLPTSGTGYISTIDQARVGPTQLYGPTGYTALSFRPEAPGLFYIEFNRVNSSTGVPSTGGFNTDLFDITVTDTVSMVAKPGRVYSQAWQFTESGNFGGTTYIYSNDSIITSAAFANMNGGTWIQFCNQNGCGTSGNFLIDRMSLYNQQALLPQYKIFLNNPDPEIFPPATTLGQIIAPDPWGERFCNNGNIIFHVFVDKPGDVTIFLDFDPPYTDLTLPGSVVPGENLVTWDGLDGGSPRIPVPNNVNITFSVSYINGLTNLPLYDVEDNASGFNISLISPSGTAPYVFWDDSNINSYAGFNIPVCPPNGCQSPPGCHSWTGNDGNLNTVNTWWYNVSSSTTPVTIVEWRRPQTLVFVQTTPQNICPFTTGNIFSVTPDPNTNTYFWSYTGTGATINHANPGDSFITVDFAGNATPGNIEVYGTNNNCPGAGPTSTLAINILPTPALSNDPMNKTICSGDNVNINLTSSTPGTAYSWTVTSTPNITGYPASGSGASISHVLTNSINTPGTVWYVITPSANGCDGEDTTFTVTVSPKPVITNPPPYTKTICSEAFTDLTITSSIPVGTTFSWTVSPNTLGASAGSNATGIINQQLTNPGGTILSVTYTITPDNNGCIGNSINYIVTVNPKPLVTNAPPSKTICSGIGTNISLTSNVAGATFSWTVVDNPNVTGEMNGNGSLINQTLTNNSYISQDVVYTITPTANACTGTSIDYTVTIRPDPDVSNTTLDLSQCSGETTNINLTSNVSGTTFSWIASGPPGTSGFSNGSGALIAQQLFNSNLTSAIVQYAVTPSANLCNGLSKTFNVTVYPLPVPTIAGPTARCLNTSGVYTTQAGMSNYTWVVPPGAGTITSGAGTNAITVNWIATGMHTISVNFNDANGCTAISPTTYNVTVNPLPNPTVSGPGAVCLNQSNTYSTEIGMSNYTWTLSPDGTILSGGGTASVNISWSTVGVKTVLINYNDPNGCTAPAPTSYTVTVNVLPVPTLSGLDQVCVNNTETYTTESGMQNYQWTVSPGGTVIAGGTGTSPSVTVTWTATGARSVSVNYSLGTGCAGAAPTVRNVMVNPKPSPNISGPMQVCELSQNVVYQALPSTPGNTYDWTVAGGTIVSGQGTSTLTINWGSYGTGLLDVNETITTTGCDAPAPTFSVTLDPYPLTPGPITGVDEICRAQSGLLFSVPPVTYATSTIWNYTGTGINFTQIDPLTVSIDFGLTATSGLLQVRGNNACGNGPVMEKQIDVHPLPVISFALCQDTCSIDTKPFTLKGAYPFGGLYSGQGVVGGNSFNPASLLPGKYRIRYTIANTFTCVDSAYAFMTVIPATPAIACGQLLTDARDGKQYPTVQIGSRCWMAQNLNFGIRIQDNLSQKDNCSHEKYCYSNLPANCNTLGGLYQWNELMQYNQAEGSQGICPAGWHVATEDDWADLFAQYSGPSQSGNPMKSTGFSGFNASFTGGTFQNIISDFSNEAVFFWSSTQHGKDHAWAHSLNVETPSVSFKPALKANAFYVRCVRD